RTAAAPPPLLRRTTRRTPPLAGRTKLRGHAHDLLRQTSRLRRSLCRVHPKAAISRAGRATISLLAPAYVRPRRRSLDARDRRFLRRRRRDPREVAQLRLLGSRAHHTEVGAL